MSRKEIQIGNYTGAARDTGGGAYGLYTAPIDWEHVTVHDGALYVVSATWFDDNRVADDANADLIIDTPADKAAHILFLVFTLGDFELRLYEGITYNAETGTAITPQNFNRTFSNTAVTTARQDATVSSTGTLIHTIAIPAGTGVGFFSSVTSSSIRGDNEWVFKNGTAYLLRLTNRSGGARMVTSEIALYEAAP
jgi:hypothetical protein